MKLPENMFYWIYACLLVVVACQVQTTSETEVSIDNSVQQTIYQPAQDLQELFHEVQMSGTFPDSKTFVDCRPLSDPQDILVDYHELKERQQVDLLSFVDEKFEIPGSASGGAIQSKENMNDHLKTLWPLLTRNPDPIDQVSSLLPLPFPYVVPGGRFREIYYWDSYFTMLGLLESAEDSLVINMIRNFGHLIDTHGFIPNGNRSYYLGRSQPPFFSSMVMLWADRHGLEAAVQFLPQLHKEYDFWMQGMERLSSNTTSNLRVVLVADSIVLNRYWDNIPQPRPESYKEDVELAESFPEVQRVQVYRDLRAGAESGWDYSSRWFSDGQSLDSIITTQIIPVDLNCLLYFLERTLSEMSRHTGNSQDADFFDDRSERRAKAIREYFWDPDMGYFSDFNLTTGTTTTQFSAAGIVPLYFQIATNLQADKAAAFLSQHLLFPGGIASTKNDTGQQWDYPNGWAPQQWMAIQGLKHYQKHELAHDIAGRWVALAEQVFKNTGKMMEKYNVADLSLAAGGGEYPTQDGFGWTNGVTLALQSLLEKDHK